MDTVRIHPKNKEQLAAVKAFAKALNMDFETKVGEKISITRNLLRKF